LNKGAKERKEKEGKKENDKKRKNRQTLPEESVVVMRKNK